MEKYRDECVTKCDRKLMFASTELVTQLVSCLARSVESHLSVDSI